MRKRDAWVCQDRRCDTPWALHVTMMKDRRNLGVVIDVYAEWVDGGVASSPLIDARTSGLATQFVRDACESCGRAFTDEDDKQVRQALSDLKGEFN